MYPSGESSGGLSQLQGMASMFGMNMGGSESTFHIPDIINSRTLQTKIIYKKWDTDLFSSPEDLITFWGINDKNKFSKDAGDKSLEWETSALGRISNRISINEGKTGLISVYVLMEESEISAQIANFIYEGVVELTNVNHNEKATLNREFIEGRQLEVKAQLIAFEDALKVFRERNRSIMDSPQLQLEVERLLRDVEIQTQVFITLQQQYELARIEEVKETPSVVVLDKGFPSVYKDSPRRKLIVFLFTILGFFIGNLYIIYNKFS